MKNKLTKAISSFILMPGNRILLLFALEGLLLQFVGSSNGFGNNLYATNLGATDTQIGMIQLFSYIIPMFVLVPAGIISDRMRNSRILPMIILLIMGVMYFCYASVPIMGSARMVFFFIFLALTTGMLGTYNAMWQAFFADVVPSENRNRVYAMRYRMVCTIAILIPLVIGAFMGAQPERSGKLVVLRVFYYIAGALMLIQAFVLSRIPIKDRPKEDRKSKFDFSMLRDAVRFILTDRKFRTYFLCIMFFYFSWHCDWSMWYIGETQYVGMTEQHLSYFTASMNVAHLLMISVLERMNRKKSVYFTFIFGILGLVFCPITMLTSINMPKAAAPWVFIVMGTIANLPQAGVMLCTVQMLLDVVPEKNRALIISLYTVFVTISNGVMPFLGVRFYTLLGADFRAVTIFNVCVLTLRSMALALFIVRYLRMKRRGEIRLPA